MKSVFKKKCRVLITCGPTWVPIDDVRVISNIASGEIGHLIARALRSQGAFVSLIEGPVTHKYCHSRDFGCIKSASEAPEGASGNPGKKIKIIKYRFFDELARVLGRELLKKYDIIIHAAAVSDFSATIRGGSPKIFGGKVPSDRSLTLKLIPMPKLIDIIKRLSPESFLVGFKLEPNLNLKNIFKAVKPLFVSAGCDLVVANSLKNGYRGFIVNANGDILSKTTNKQALAKKLVKIIT